MGRLATASIVAAAFIVGGLMSFLSVGRFRIPDTASPAISAPVAQSVEAMQQFQEFPVFWLGESFEGLPLTSVIRYVYPGTPGIGFDDSEDLVSFSYGDCFVPEGVDTGCPVPLTIETMPYCKVPPSQLADAVKVGPPFTIRGALAQRTGPGSLRLWTRTVTIGIYATNPDHVLKAAEAMVRINGGIPTRSSEDLGPPDPTIVCPPKSLQ